MFPELLTNYPQRELLLKFNSGGFKTRLEETNSGGREATTDAKLFIHDTRVTHFGSQSASLFARDLTVLNNVVNSLTLSGT